MSDSASREPEERLSQETARPPVSLTSDIPSDQREGRFVTLTVGGNVDEAQTHPTDANPEARG